MADTLELWHVPNWLDEAVVSYVADLYDEAGAPIASGVGLTNSLTEETALWNRPQQGLNFGIHAGIDIGKEFRIGTGNLNNQYGILYASAFGAWNDGYSVTMIGGKSSGGSAPGSLFLKGGPGSGTNIAGAPINIAGGQGTGTGVTGVVNVQAAPAGSTGSSANALVTVAQFDADATAGNTRFLIYDVDNATLERVSVGAADSGGAGYKVLRIPN